MRISMVQIQLLETCIIFVLTRSVFQLYYWIVDYLRPKYQHWHQRRRRRVWIKAVNIFRRLLPTAPFHHSARLPRKQRKKIEGGSHTGAALLPAGKWNRTPGWASNGKNPDCCAYIFTETCPPPPPTCWIKMLHSMCRNVPWANRLQVKGRQSLYIVIVSYSFLS